MKEISADKLIHPRGESRYGVDSRLKEYQMRFISLLLLGLILSACSSTLERPVKGDRTITPKEVAQDSKLAKAGVVEWGGVIVEPRNLEATTEFQIIAYPLRQSGRPDLDKSPTGRFIAVSPGYLETGDYAKGRQVTLSGRIAEIRPGKVGEADYEFPIIESDDIHLWPIESNTRSKSSVRFGLGVGSGGRSGGSIGIGVGF